VVVVVMAAAAAAVSIKKGKRRHAPGRVMYSIDELIQLIPLRIREQARLFVPPREVNVHVGHGVVVVALRAVCRRLQ
jgi:hypothetical protein